MIFEYSTTLNVTATDVGCDRAGAPIVRGVSFASEKGRALQLFGPNGSGKSSLLGVFAGLVPCVSGEISWTEDGDGEVASFNRAPSNAICFVGHQTSLKAALTAAENLRFWARQMGVANGDRERRISEALSSLRISDFADAQIGKLSAGQRRRVDLARLMLDARPFWLLDEPIAALDIHGAKIVTDIIAEHLQAGGGAIIATHDDLRVPSTRLEIGQ